MLTFTNAALTMVAIVKAITWPVRLLLSIFKGIARGTPKVIAEWIPEITFFSEGKKRMANIHIRLKNDTKNNLDFKLRLIITSVTTCLSSKFIARKIDNHTHISFPADRSKITEGTVGFCHQNGNYLDLITKNLEADIYDLELIIEGDDVKIVKKGHFLVKGSDIEGLTNLTEPVSFPIVE